MAFTNKMDKTLTDLIDEYNIPHKSERPEDLTPKQYQPLMALSNIKVDKNGELGPHGNDLALRTDTKKSYERANQQSLPRYEGGKKP